MLAVMNRSGRPEAALAVLEPRLAGTAPGDAELHFVAARASQALGRAADAERHLAAAAERAPISRAAVLLAAMRSEAGRHAEAAALLAPIAEGEPLDLLAARDPRFAAEIAVHYGRTLLALGRAAEAVPYLRRGAEASADDAALWRLLGETLVELERVDEARDAIARAHEIDEAEHRRDVERQALAADREHQGGLGGLALGLIARGRLSEAEETVSELLARWPDDPLALRARERIQALRSAGAG
jgi:predicted Zn-dependent protease